MSDGSLGRKDLECGKCFKLKQGDNIPPICEGGTCPIQDLAQDPLLNRMVNEYTTRRMLFEMTKSEIVYNKLCKDFGFYKDPQFHFQCESIFIQWRHNQREQKKKL